MQLHHQNSHGSTQESLKEQLAHHQQAQSHRLSSGSLLPQHTNGIYQQQQQKQYNSFLAARRGSNSTQNSLPSSCDAMNLAKEAQAKMQQTYMHHNQESSYVNDENFNHQNMIQRQQYAQNQFVQNKNGGNQDKSDQQIDTHYMEYLQNLQSIQNQNYQMMQEQQNFNGQVNHTNALASRSHRQNYQSTHDNSSAIAKSNQRHSNLQNYGMQQRMNIRSNENEANASYQQDTSLLTNQSFNQQNITQMSFQPQNQSQRQSLTSKNSKTTQIAFDYQQPQDQQMLRDNSNQRAVSGDPAPRGVISQGSAGSHGSHTYQRINNSGSDNIFSTGYLAMIRCPCLPEISRDDGGFIRASRGLRSKPIVQSTEKTANCGRCGQFYAVKDSQQYTQHISASGRKQITSNAQIQYVKTVRTSECTYKLDEPIAEIFKRMRQISEKVKTLKPHPIYLSKRVRRIDNLSYIADMLQSDNQTIHHAVHLMDVYSSKMPKDKEYDTILISLCCLLISTKFLQIKYPGADALNDMVQRRYSADQIIDMEGKVLDVINWELMAYPIYDYVKMFISQGCLFENEEIIKNTSNSQASKERDKPTVELAAHFKKYAEFFADFCLYQESLMTVDAYNLACAIIAYTRKYMGVAIIWSTEMILLTSNTYPKFSDLYEILQEKYTDAFPEHASTPNFPDQIMVEPVPQQTAQQNIRKNIANQLQLSSGGKMTQGSSNKPVSNNKYGQNTMMDLKTPDKCVFDFNSVVSGTKDLTQGKSSHEKFQINSNSVEKFRLQKKNNNSQNLKIIEVSNNKGQAQVFSDNKRQSINAQSFKQIIMKNQVATTFSDEKQTAQPSVGSNYLPYQKRAHNIKSNADLIKQVQDAKSSQKSQSNNRQTRNSQMSMINSTGVISSPSANIDDAGTEQEVPPTKPMIIKSNSQAIGGGYECKTTTKKSPKGADLEKINALKESMNAVNITAKLPSSTTNQTGTKVNLNFNNSSFNQIFHGKRSGVASSYGTLGFNGHGPIKINQKLNVMGSVTKEQNGSTAKKSKKSKNTQGTSSSQKMKMSKSYTTRIGITQSQTLNNTYHQRLAEQRASVATKSNQNQTLQSQRNVSCTSHNQKKTNPQQYSFISGKPKNNMGNQVYQQQPQGDNEGTNQEINPMSSQPRSVLSVKNAAQAIKRKSSFANGPTLDLRVNINKAQGVQVVNQIMQNSQQTAQQIVQPASKIGKNVPNGLLRKATGGVEGRQTSIGKLSYYRSNSNNGIKDYRELAKQINKEVTAQNSHDFRIDSNASEDFDASLQNPQMSITNNAVNPPAIMMGSLSQNKNKSFSNGTTLDKTKSLMKNHQNDYAQQNQSNSCERPQVQSQDGKPIQKLIKSGSQVLGKQRSRLNLTKKELLKQLNDQKDKISHMVDAANANANRCTSNEKNSSIKKPNHSDLIGLSAGIEIQSQFNLQNQLFTIKQSNTGNRSNMIDANVSNFEAMNSHSAERPYTFDKISQGQSNHQKVTQPHQQIQDENMNSQNRSMQQQQSSIMQHQKMNNQHQQPFHQQVQQKRSSVQVQSNKQTQQQYQNFRV